MGRDKALLELQGIAFLEHIARVGLDAGFEVSVVGRTQPEWWPLPEVEFLPDEQPGLGPVGGLVTALAHHESDVLMLGCDMPMVTQTALRWLAGAAAAHPGSALVVGCHDGRIEPLFAVYRQSVLAVALESMERGERSLHRLVERVGAIELSLPADVVRAITNINTPEEYLRITGRF